MTQEEKRLLLVDLCMRLPYGVKVNINSPIEEQNRMELFDVNLESETATKVYDGTALSCDGYSVYGLVPGDSIGTVTVTGSQTSAGYSANTAVVTANPNPNYTVTYYKGTLLVIGTSQASVSLTTSADEVVLSGSDPISVVYSEGSVTVTQGTFVKTISGRMISII